MKLRNWIRQFEEQFRDRELDYMEVHKANISAQLLDTETGRIHLHQLEFKAKNALDLRIAGIIGKKEGQNEQSHG